MLAKRGLTRQANVCDVLDTIKTAKDGPSAKMTKRLRRGISAIRLLRQHGTEIYRITALKICFLSFHPLAIQIKPNDET